MSARKRLLSARGELEFEAQPTTPAAKRHRNEPRQQRNSKQFSGRKGKGIGVGQRRSNIISVTQKERYVEFTDGTSIEDISVGHEGFRETHTGRYVEFPHYSGGAGVGDNLSGTQCVEVPHYSTGPILRGQKRRADCTESYGEKRRKVDFTDPDQVKDLLKITVPHQISSLLNNPSLLMYFKSSSLSLVSATPMMTLLENAILCDLEPLRKRVQQEIIPKLFENHGFLEAVRIHLSSLPFNQSLRASSVSFISQVCTLFQCVLSSTDIDSDLATSILPVDALVGTTRQLATQAARFQPIHVKANELLRRRDKARETLYNIVGQTFDLKNDTIVLPTKEELEKQGLREDLPPYIIKGEYPNTLQYIDTQYRYLREDLIGPLCCAFHKMINSVHLQEGEEVAEEIMEEGEKIMDEGEVTIINFGTSSDSQNDELQYVTIKRESYSTYECSTFEISFKVSGHQCINWDCSERFKYGDLLCLMNDDHSTVLFATIADRNVEDLKKGILTVNIITDVDVMDLPPSRYRMIESPGFYAAYAPILRHLYALRDKADSLPFAKYIVKLEKEIQRPQYISDQSEYVLNLHTAICAQHEPDECPCKSVNLLDKEAWAALPTPNLDNSQKTALHSALTQELSIIQGPPGTGKTYLGIKIVETLLQNRNSWNKVTLAQASTSTIVVVCYTNHALDQFLEGIIKKIGVTIPTETKVRRIGSRSKSELLQEYNINIFVTKHLRKRKIFGFQRKSNKQIMCKLDALQDLLESKFDPEKVKAYASLLGPEIFHVELDPVPVTTQEIFHLNSAEKMACWLGLSPISYDYEHAQASRKIAGENEGNEVFEDFGREQLHAFFSDFTKVEPLTEERAHKIIKGEQIDAYVRLQLFKYCLKGFKDELKKQLKMGKENEERYDIRRKLATLHCLGKADIIGVTTTGAAKFNSLLSEINAKIVIIEEAAEVLEAHTVSSLGRNTQHLILIGDHKQLRPKTTDYTLARDYHFDVSLFERLVSNGLPHVTLQMQHRMRPEISALVSSCIYNDQLRDAPGTETFPPVPGMKRNLFFIDHSEPEASDTHLFSVTNDFEARFLARLCKYLLQQKTYNQKQVTVITPYTGQMFHMRDRLAELDMLEVRVTTIDSYQGEENDIILLSLVRSKVPGFVKNENRICVAMSRARHGLYVIGNFSKLFECKSPLWRALVKCVKSRQQFDSNLPVECQQHRAITKITRPEDFDSVSHGGCPLRCESRLPCRHMCPFKCHPDPDNNSHENIQCKQQCPNYCYQGHRCKKKCFECKITCGPCKDIVEKVIPSCGHKQPVPCFCKAEDFICQEPCTERLPCGHQCKAKCGEAHTRQCPELVTKQCPHGHKGKAECYITDECYSRQCKAPCGEELKCGHICKGTCGGCRQGRLHKSCKEKCSRILTCGHNCTSPCANNCPPCSKLCQMICLHGSCDHICRKQCLPCPHDCERKCEHRKCTRLCGKPCDCPPCDEPCPEKLSCGHNCMGLCGEKCPYVCQICDKDTFHEKVPLIFGTEDPEESPGLRIIMLDCGHMFDVESLDKCYRESDEKIKVQWLQCLMCKKTVFKTNRYKDMVLRISEDLNSLKVREQMMSLSDEVRQQLRNELKLMVQESLLIKGGNIPIDGITDRRLEAEYIIFHAEQRVRKGMAEMGVEMNTATQCDNLQSSMTALRIQTEDFMSRLKMYRRDEVVTGQVLDDIQAEQRRIQLISAVIKVQAQFKTKNVQLERSEQEKLETFMMQYEVRSDRACRMKITPDVYKDSVWYLNELKKKHPTITGLTQEERRMIIQTLHTKPGSWYKCPNGHLYNIGECGGAMETSTCPECKSTIGGGSHRLAPSNAHAGEFDGSTHAAWPIWPTMTLINDL